jgi:type II secretory pathway pseudopilin PulG
MSKGFSIIEAVAALMILAIMAGLLIPVANSLVDTQRTATAREDLRAIYSAIVGNPNQNTFGYLGDVGDYPSSLMDLVQTPTGAAPATCPSWSCWNGPYLSNARIDSGLLLDVFGAPVEYFQTATAGNVSDNLTIISKGPDRSSSNTTNTNNRTPFLGTLPTNSAYVSQIGNADNVAYPSFVDNPGVLKYQNVGTLSYNLYNFDSNTLVNANVPGCPALYTVQITSVPRGANDSIGLAYNPGGTSIDLVQGLYRVRVSAPTATGSLWEEQVSIKPGAHVAQTINLGALVNSSATATYTLTVINNIGFTIRVYEFGTSLGTVNNGATGNFAGTNACSRISVVNNASNAPVDAFTYPNMNYTKRYGATNLYTLTVTNSGANNQLKVNEQGLLIGLVGSEGNKKTKSFLNVRQGSTVTIMDANNNLLMTFTMPGSNYSTTV